MELETTVSEHYAALTERIEHYSGDVLACHFGLWGPDTTTHREALLRANRKLVQGCDLGPGRHLLDAGCGVGGTAIALAENWGINVTGLTICEPHIAVATQFAEERGVGHLVEFHYGDFMDLPFPDAQFDAVLNHESFCYAEDKHAYLHGVFRVLKPGGRWQALEGLLSGAPMSEEQKASHAAAQRGWRMPPLEPLQDVLAILEDTGFVDIRKADLSSEAATATKRLHDGWLLLTLTSPRPRGIGQASHDFMEATIGYNQGLRDGVFTYHFLSAARPT